MKSLVCVTPGEFAYQDRPAPVPAPGNAVIRIRRIGICGTDLHAFEGTQPFFQYPRILGHELSGILTDQTEVPGFQAGENVTFLPYFACGNCVACRQGRTNACASLLVSGVHTDGGMVEYLSVPADLLVHNEGLTLDELALVEPLAIGAHAVRRAAIREDEFVLVVGAGPIGLGTMEMARIAGGRVIALDVNADRLAFCRNTLHLPYTLDAGADNVPEALRELTNGDWPTVVFDATGNAKAIMAAFSYLAHGGRYILVGLQKGDVSFSHPEFHKREATLMSSRNATRQDFEHVVQALKSGRIKAANYITHRVEFGQVKEAFPTWLDPATGVIKAMVHLD